MTELDDMGEILGMVVVLGEAGYRELSSTAGQQRLAVCRRLWREGVTVRLLRMLWLYARSCDRQGTPERLLSYWLDRPKVALEKCNEMREKNDWIRAALDRAARPMETNVDAALHSIEEWRRRKGGPA